MDPERFGPALAALAPKLRRFAHALARSPADADDLAQMALERAWSRRSQFEPGTSLQAWLYRIARNIWIDQSRSRLRAEKWTAPEEAGLNVGEDARPAIEARLDAGAAMRALARLPDEQREAVALVLVEGLGYREAAEVLGLPIGTVSSRLARGREALLKLIG